MENIIENNKLIAEFMEYPKHKIDFVGKRLNFENSKHNTYHKDWNWLMKVVEKCLVGEAEYNEDEAKKAIREIYESLCNINISSVYNACVEFIKWYNEQNKNNEKHTCIIDK